MKSIKINQRVKDEINKAAEVAEYMWNREWAERSGGNISINITDILDQDTSNCKGFRFIECDKFPKGVAQLIFFVTGSGERLREMKIPEETGCIIRFNENATGFYILWGGKEHPGFRPSSELLPHVKIHLDKLSSQSKHRAVVHTHPNELICITYHPKFSQDEKALNNVLWSMIPEVRVFVPKGVGITQYTLPGSEELSDRTVEALKKRDLVMWNKHGAISTGEDAHVAFDYIDVANKGAKLYLQCLASRFVPEGLNKDEMQELVEAFNL
ncbi:MAG: rhamnulose-1-phosphate aldolase [SAR324 cluster bacterium]|nr:rhamnulose-1-phosphate aldolase [SAR324 cluster bacterium]